MTKHHTNGTAPHAAVYARVSTTDQADKGYSLPTQIDECLAFARQCELTVREDHIFTEDYTGTSLRRPVLTTVRELVRNRLVQAVIVHDIDRLSRKLVHQLLLTEEFEQHGASLLIVTMPQQDKTPEGQLLANVRGIIAEYERVKILERTERGRRGRVQAGFVPGGRRPLGYRYVKHPVKGASYEIDPDEAALVQRIFRLYVHDGLSQEAIAALLTREEVPTPAERMPGVKHDLPLWQYSTIKGILANAMYTGTQHYGKTMRMPGKKNPDKKTRHRAVPRDAWLSVDVPSIIDEALFEAAQAKRIANGQRSPRNRKRAYLLQGARLRCGQCGCAMSGVTPHGKRARYICTRRPYQNAETPHTIRSVAADTVEEAVWQAVERALRNPTLIAAEVTRRQQGTQTQHAALDAERQQYQRQLAQCEKDLKRWEAAYIGEAINLVDFKGKKAEIDARRASVEHELARLDEQDRLIEQAKYETVTLTAYCKRVAKRLQRFTLDEKHLALEALSITVTWHPEKPLNIKGSIPVSIDSSSTGELSHAQSFVVGTRGLVNLEVQHVRS